MANMAVSPEIQSELCDGKDATILATRLHLLVLLAQVCAILQSPRSILKNNSIQKTSCN